MRRRSCGVSRLQNIRNVITIKQIYSDKTILYAINTKRLVWYGHVVWMLMMAQNVSRLISTTEKRQPQEIIGRRDTRCDGVKSCNMVSGTTEADVQVIAVKDALVGWRPKFTLYNACLLYTSRCV